MQEMFPFEKTLDIEFERKNVSPVTRLQKYIALNSNIFKKETALKLLKKKPEEKIIEN